MQSGVEGTHNAIGDCANCVRVCVCIRAQVDASNVCGVFVVGGHDCFKGKAPGIHYG